MNLAAVGDYFTGLQARIVAALEAIDGGEFLADEWLRPGDSSNGHPGGGIDSLPPVPLPREGGDGRSPSSHSNADAALERSGGGIDSLPPVPLPREGGDGRSPSSHSNADAALERSGGGITRIIEEGALFERGGVNFSRVRGDRLPPSASASRPELSGRGFEATGISVVLHPRNPYCPTAHMNVRLFAASGDDPVWWFGGGMDLTPYYGFEEDARHFHRTCKAALDPYGAELHARYKAWCDRYFFLKHRNEPRGVGGIFFDDVNEGGFERCFALARSVGDSFLDAYLPIIERRRDIAYTDRERDFQAYRRGRYVEFNLVYDRGTLFGLQSGGRTEAILMSLPPLVKWRYDWQPAAASAEEKLYTDFLVARDWL